MTALAPEQWRQARDLFEAIVDAPPADLEAWLLAHSDDARVRAEVASLLRHHSGAGEFLSRPVGDLSQLLDDSHAETDDSEPAPLTPGQRLGRYRVEREAGRGGMGRVYRATDTQLNRTVAIKALPAGTAPDASQRERLRREAQASARLTHPGVCTVYALEELDGQLYLVSEFIEGETLRDVIARQDRPTAAVVVDVATQLAAALASAHTLGITHRDLKPENVMRTTNGRIKILDFGLARQQRPLPGTAASLVTQPGMLVGTPAYMSPEQLNGGVVLAATDVFAFGVVMYEYATGQHPFDAPTVLARVGRILEATPEPLAQRRPDLPEHFTKVITQCLAKSPADRFESAEDLTVAIAFDPETFARSLASTAGPGAEPLTVPGTTAGQPADAALTGRSWWRVHQVAVIGMYLTAAILGWFIKEWLRGPASWGFIALGVLGTIAGMLRGHLLFTERTHGVGLVAERRRLEPVTLVCDLAIALVLGLDGLALFAASREVSGVMTLALAVAVAIARLVLEPGTARAAFGDPTDGAAGAAQISTEG